MKLGSVLLPIVALMFSASASAHVGSPDVYYDGKAGPYRLFVTVRTPPMIPGIARIEVQVLEGRVDGIQIVPLRVIGEGSENAPPPDSMERSKSEAQFFTGKLWLMSSGSMQVRMEVHGPPGSAEIAVPVAAFAQRTLRMERTTGAILSVLMIFLSFSFISIFGAAVRESQLQPGQAAPPAKRRWAGAAMGAAGAAIVGILFLGNMWWTSIANANAEKVVYKPPPLRVSLSVTNELKLKLGSSHWHELRKVQQLDKIIPDHGHLMHLFLIRVPEIDRFYHLHPEEYEPGGFAEKLPEMDAGPYAVFADVVRESGFPDTMATRIAFPGNRNGLPLTGDDSEAMGSPVSAAQTTTTVQLDSGGRVDWILVGQGLHAHRPTLLRFRVLDKNGQPAADLEPYMGMAAHLVLVRRDLSVFAHVHPAGSVPMAALMLLRKDTIGNPDALAEIHPALIPAEITFPYGFPREGDYCLFLQVKRAGHVQTGVFDAHVMPSEALLESAHNQDPGVTMKLDLLAIAAHPDDVELTCGGTLLKMAQRGYRTGILDLTAGEMGTRGTPETRAKEAAQAAKLLGVKWREALGVPDSDVQPSRLYKLRLATVIRQVRPKTVILPYWEARHPDHYHASTLGYEACFLAGLKQLPIEEEPYRPFKILYSTAYARVHPTFVVDISKQFEQRRRAILAYRSQFRPKAGSRGSKVHLAVDRLEDEMAQLARHYGQMIGVRYGEPFLTKELMIVEDVLEMGVRSI